MKLKANFSAKGVPENDNCYIRAVATATNIEYDEALMLCLEAGWDHGMLHSLAVKMAVVQGWNVIACQWDEAGSILPIIDEHATFQFPMCCVGVLSEKLKASKKTFIVFTNDHAFCIKNGYVYDSGNTGRMKRVAMLFELPTQISQELDWSLDVGDELY